MSVLSRHFMDLLAYVQLHYCNIPVLVHLRLVTAQRSNVLFFMYSFYIYKSLVKWLLHVSYIDASFYMYNLVIFGCAYLQTTVALHVLVLLLPDVGGTTGSARTRRGLSRFRRHHSRAPKDLGTTALLCDNSRFRLHTSSSHIIAHVTRLPVKCESYKPTAVRANTCVTVFSGSERWLG